MQSRSRKRTIVIGGGAAGFFGAIHFANNPLDEVILLEKSNTLLAKVKVSGGGRCNVTHACFDPKALVENYPRGAKELLAPFTRFQPKDMMAWLESRGVALKIEKDGRVFPQSDTSQTIIDCFLREAKAHNVSIQLQAPIEKVEKQEKGFIIHLRQETLYADRVLLATGSSSQGYKLAAALGHTIVEPVPSLFTFHVPLSPLKDLSGISVEKVLLTLPETSFSSSGPLLITHFGFSGPAVLKLSAFGARALHAKNYRCLLNICWIEEKEPMAKLLRLKEESPQQSLGKSPFPLPTNLWRRFLAQLSIDPTANLRGIANKKLHILCEKLRKDSYEIEGKTSNKEEFVTAGGVQLSEVNFKTMESKVVPHLYFAGEVLNIYGVTGGFNFQSAWTTAWLAAKCN